MRVAIILAFVLLAFVALTLADDRSNSNTKDVQTPAEDRKMLLKLGKKLMKMMKKRPPPRPAPYVPYAPPPPSYGGGGYGAPPPSYGGPPPYRR